MFLFRTYLQKYAQVVFLQIIHSDTQANMNILITGASRGIGFDTSIELVKQGHHVLAIARNEEKLENLKKLAQNFEPNLLQTLAFDLTNTHFEPILEEIENWGHLDILIHNAGTLINKNFEQNQVSDWQTTFELNFFSVLALTQKLLPFLKKGQDAHILNIGSMAGFQGSSKFGGLAVYGASKAALAGFTEGLAQELKNDKIAVNCLALGAVQTQMLAEAFPNYQTDMSSQKMAQFIAYFSTNGQHFFNGKILPVSTSTP